MKKQKSSLKLHLFSGFHDPSLSDQFRSSLLSALRDVSPSLSFRFEIICYPIQSVGVPNLNSDIHLFIGFSAGVIRAAIAAHLAQGLGQTVAGLIAIDGWGVPLCDRSYPVYRFSHDSFTHLTSSLLGAPGIFFADPPVEHLYLWEHPQKVTGWYSIHTKDLAKVSASKALVQTIQSLVSRKT